MSRALALALVLSACGPVDLVVLDVPDAGDLPMTGLSCARDADCMAGQFCEKDSCGATLGTCSTRPAVCDGDGPAVCGCDGVNYFNDCLRRASGVGAVREMGPCRNPTPCDTTTPCANGYCARVVGPMECGRVGPGQCWVLPEMACRGPAPTFHTCDASRTCLGLCDAIRLEQPVELRPRNAPPCP